MFELITALQYEDHLQRYFETASGMFREVSVLIGTLECTLMNVFEMGAKNNLSCGKGNNSYPMATH